MTFLNQPTTKPAQILWTTKALIGLIDWAEKAKMPGYVARVNEYREALFKAYERENRNG
jgi:hypothetical protein